MNYKDISIGKYKKMISISKDNGENEYVLDLVSLLYDVDAETLPVADLLGKMKELQFLRNPIPKTNVKEEYTLNGKKYELDLTPADFTAAQFLEWQGLVKDGDLAKMISVVLLPKGKKYGEDYDVDVVVREIDEFMSIVDGTAIVNFFVGWCGRYVDIIRRYLSYLMKKMKMEKETRKQMEALMEQMQTLGEFFRI